MLSRDLKDRNRQLPDDAGRTVWLSDGLLSIDLNCDMGEGMPDDAAIMPFVSSANIACGYHAGDEATMRGTVELALANKVAIGAHPSYPDRENFGRLDMLSATPMSQPPNVSPSPHSQPPLVTAFPATLTPGDLPFILITQLATLQKICHRAGARLHHVKLHGALYNRASHDADLSMLICLTIKEFDPTLLLYGPGDSVMEAAAIHFDIPFVREAFADRTYREDGSLTPRSEPHALIEDTAQAISQVLTIVREGRARTLGGQEIPLNAQTVCIHGDGRHAVQLARAIYETLMQHQISIQAP